MAKIFLEQGTKIPNLVLLCRQTKPDFNGKAC